MNALPGSELVEKGLADLAAGIESDEALLVSIGAPRLAGLGYDVSRAFDSPEKRLYERLSAKDGDAAHGRYNGLVRRLVSFERAAEPIASASRPPSCAGRRGRRGDGDLPDGRRDRGPPRLAREHDRRRPAARAREQSSAPRIVRVKDELRVNVELVSPAEGSRSSRVPATSRRSVSRALGVPGPAAEPRRRPASRSRSPRGRSSPSRRRGGRRLRVHPARAGPSRRSSACGSEHAERSRGPAPSST